MGLLSMVFIVANWIATLTNYSCRIGKRTNRGHGLVTSIYFVHTLALCYCQRGTETQKNHNSEISSGLIAGIVIIVVLLALVLSLCIFCRRCKGKKQRELKARKAMYAVPGSRPSSALSQGRPTSAVSVISNAEKPRLARPVNDIEVIEEDIQDTTPDIVEHPPSPFSPM